MDASKRRRGIYLLPNLLTTGCLFFGFFAIISAFNGDFRNAALAIFIAMVFDGLDGRVARMTNTQSDFGVQFDSIADMVSFGVGPALVAWIWALSGTASLPGPLAKLGLLIAFVYAACAALRLARFNTQVGMADKRYFQGLPSPAAAGVVAGLIWVGDHLGISDGSAMIASGVIVLTAGLLMVSRLRYYSFKEVDFRYRVPFFTMVVVLLALAFLLIHPPTVLFAGFFIYMLSGPALTWHQRRRRVREGRSG
ncbi:CDP-diacylglycerol--serine O-phosphatidyltransferase [Alkalilimnicola ehrlichii MLHE-1]|uniref:CDP-diacylglycerol--serine O-phosphatidyltransferase n=1 Tax=Alkalilimnicola ehrlichii (strain ATCC BAA-1101 / DSM 17681 / MLHE-1) TaxID=187272 RepID=Q0AB84_ALKEH|nr:CDP-diacylglycerol--serine O-phosphatidyltransferase [Alkalilimnicola ehrlichii]ABI55903.1 CDP-diacylglycerol--serine O-phosphatidyltransferase [Alkalilimnicola ehrlichii MLHE-1]